MALLFFPVTNGMPRRRASVGTTHDMTPTRETKRRATAAPTTPTQFSPVMAGASVATDAADTGSPAYDASARAKNTATVHKRRAATSRPRANVCG